MLSQRIFHASRQRGYAIALPFGVADEDLMSREVHVLHPQLQALEQPQTASVQQNGDQTGRAAEMIEQMLHLFRCEHDRNAERPPGANDVVHPWKRLTENFPIEKEERTQSLILRRRTDVIVDGQAGQEGIDFLATHRRRMTLA